MSPRPSNTQVRRLQIARAALEVISERGFQDLRVSDIAERAGTNPSSVHYHFTSKDEILDAAVSLAEDDFYEDLVTIRLESETAAETLVMLLDRAGRLAAEDCVASWRVWLEIWTRALRDHHSARTRRLLDERWRSTLSEVIRAGQHRGDFPLRADADLVALQLASLTDGLAIQFALGDPAVPGARMTELLVMTAEQSLGCELPRHDTQDWAARKRRRIVQDRIRALATTDLGGVHP